MIYAISGGWHTELGLALDAMSGPLTALKRNFSNARYLVFGWGAHDYYMAQHPGIGDILSRPSRNQTGISNALRPRPYGLIWMICRFTSARIFPQRGCKLNEPNGFLSLIHI